MISKEINEITTDVCIIGGGTAGLNCAMAAAESDCDVLVVEKAHVKRSGAIAGGIDHFMAYMENGEDWDSREAYLGYVAKVAKGAANLSITEKVYCDELPAAIERIEKLGISLRDPRNSTSTEFSAPNPWANPAPTGSTLTANN